jgi:cardiolipin synthase
MEVQETRVQTTRVLTVPNALSFLRLILLAAFLVVLLVADRPAAAVAILAAAGITDFLDGWAARRLHQISALGQVLDPFADRLTAVLVPVAMAISGALPWWVVVALVGRDALLALTVPVIRARTGAVALPVRFIGKAATFALLVGLPFVLLGSLDGDAARVALVVGWAFTLWGIALYWWSAAVYLAEIRALPRRPRASS